MAIVSRCFLKAGEGCEEYGPFSKLISIADGCRGLLKVNIERGLQSLTSLTDAIGIVLPCRTGGQSRPRVPENRSKE